MLKGQTNWGQRCGILIIPVSCWRPFRPIKLLGSDTRARRAMLHTLEGHAGWVHAVAFSADSKLLASASRDTTVRLSDLSLGSLLHRLHWHTDWVSVATFSQDSKLPASASLDKIVRFWDQDSGALLHMVTVTMAVHGDFCKFLCFKFDYFASVIAMFGYG